MKMLLAIASDDGREYQPVARHTVLTRNYAPPFCQLGLAKSMGGGGGLIIVISLVYTPLFPDTVVCTSAL